MSDVVVSTVRLSREMAAALSAVARADEMPVSEALREAIDRHIAIRRADQAFQDRVKKCLAEDREILELLSGGGTQ